MVSGMRFSLLFNNNPQLPAELRVMLRMRLPELEPPTNVNPAGSHQVILQPAIPEYFVIDPTVSVVSPP
jgi:hypothetical protein